MAGDAIWATALFLPLMSLVLGTLGPLRRGVTLWGDSHGKSAAEREAKAALDVANADEKRHSTDVHRRAIDAEVALIADEQGMSVPSFGPPLGGHMDELAAPTNGVPVPTAPPGA